MSTGEDEVPVAGGVGERGFDAADGAAVGVQVGDERGVGGERGIALRMWTSAQMRRSLATAWAMRGLPASWRKALSVPMRELRPPART